MSEPSLDEVTPPSWEDTQPAEPVAPKWEDTRELSALEPQKTQDEADAERSLHLGLVFEKTLIGEPDRKAASHRLANEMGVSPDIVESRYDDISRSYQAAQFDPARWRKENPELDELIRARPHSAELVLRDEGTLKTLVRGITKTVPALVSAYWDEDFSELNKLVKPENAEAQTKAFQDFGVTPRKEIKRVEASSTGSTVDKVSAAFGHGMEQDERSVLWFDNLWADVRGKERNPQAQQRLSQLEETSAAYDYNANPLQSLAIDAAELAPSTIASLKGTGVAGSIAGVTTYAITRSPKLAFAVASVAGRAGAAFQSFRREAGSAYDEMLRETTAEGKPVDPREAQVAALLYGSFAAAVDMVTFGKEVEAVAGPLGTAFAKGDLKAFVAAVRGNGTLRAAVMDGVKRTFGGALAEGTQEAVQQVGQDLATSVVTKKLDPEKMAENAAESFSKAFTGTIGATPVHTTTTVTQHLAANEYIRRKSAEGAQKAGALIKGLANSITAKGDPDAVAHLIEQETAKNGEPVTSVHVDPAAVSRFFQSQNIDPNEGITQLMGEEGPRHLQEAIATDSKLEVPMAVYADKWAKHDINKTLGEDVALQPGLKTARELKTEKEAIDADVKALVEDHLANDTPPASEAERRLVDEVESQLARTGAYSVKDARYAVALKRALLRTQAIRSGLSPDALFENYVIKAQRANAAPGTQAATLNQRLSQGPTEGTAQPGPVWHSAVLKAAESAKQEKGDAASWKSVISKTAGVKKEEYDLIGLDDWLDSQKGTVTKQQVRDFIAANKIEVTEKVLGETLKIPEKMRETVLAEGMPLFQGQPNKEDARGYVEIIRDGLKKTFAIHFGHKADLSTYLHENGHIFLEMMRDLSARADSPEALRSDWQTTLDWLGVKSGEDIKTEHHEKWARGFERYLMEGKAPSAELASAFERFKIWLTNIYRQAANLNVEIDENIRGVFDRLLATDEEIERQKLAMGLQPMWRSPEAAGMSPTEWQAYLEAQERATSHAARSTELRLLKDKLRENERWWKEEFEKHRDEARIEYSARPEVRAYEYLRTGLFAWESEAGVPRISQFDGPQKLDRKETLSLLGATETPKGLGGVLKDEGQHPDGVAELFGFASGKELLESILNRPEREAWAKEQADARMKAAHPDVLSERNRLTELVGKGLHGDFTKEVLLREWKTLKQRATGSGRSTPIEAIRRAAKQIATGRTLRELDSGRTLAAERSSAAKAAVAAAKGDYAQAYVFKQQQLLNHFLYSELAEAREQREAFLDLAAKLSKDSARAKLGKAAIQYRDGVDTILEALGLKEPEQRETQPAGLNEVVSLMEENSETVGFDPELVGRLIARPRSYKSLTVAEMREVVNALKNIETAARNRNTALIDRQRVSKEQVKNALLAEAARLPSKGPARSSVGAMSAIEKGLAAVSAFDGELLRIETLIEWLGGDVESMWNRAVFKPMNDSKIHESDILRTTMKPVMDALNNMPTEVRRRVGRTVDGAKLFPNHRKDIQAPTRGFELLAMALNAGNDSNMQRLTEGRNITRQEVINAINTELTKEEMDWVQSVIDAFESMWPMAADLEERDSGIRPPKIQATPIVTKHGTYRGGYFPVVYDRSVARAGEVQAANAVASLMDPTFTRPGTSRGHLKGRAENFADVIALDLSAVQAHLAQTAHDIAFREAVKSVGSLILDSDIQATLKQRLGDGKAALFLQWVKDAGQMRGAEVLSHARWFNRLLNSGKSRMGPAILGYAVDVVMGDLSNPFVAVAGTDLKAKHMVAGLAEFLRSPLQTLAFVHEKSGELRFRDNSFQTEFASRMRSLNKKGNALSDALDLFTKHAFQVFEWSEKLTTTGVWVGAYRQAIQEGKSEEVAVSFADQVVRKVVPANSPIDKPELLRSKGAPAVLLMFHGYMNTVYNLKRNAINPVLVKLGEGDVSGAAKATPQAAAKYLGIAIGVALMSEFFSGKGPEADDGEDENERWATWAKRKLLMDTFQPVPVASEIAETIQKAASGKSSSFRAAPGVAMVGEVIKSGKKAFDGDAEEWDRTMALMKALGFLGGLPTNRPLRAVDYLHDVATGEQSPSDPFDAASGFLYGTRERKGADPFSQASKAVSGE